MTRAEMPQRGRTELAGGAGRRRRMLAPTPRFDCECRCPVACLLQLQNLRLAGPQAQQLRNMGDS